MKLNGTALLGLGFVVALSVVLLQYNGALKAAADRARLSAQNDSARVALARWQVAYDSVVGVSDRTDTVIVRIREGAAGALATADSARIATDALRDALTASRGVRDSLTASLAVVASQGAEIASLRLVTDSLTVALDLMTQEAQRWESLARAAVPVMAQADAALEAEADARACRLLGTVKAPCVRLPGFVTDGLKVGAGVALGLWVSR